MCLSLISSLYSSQKAIEASERLRDTNAALVAINEQQKKDLETLRADVGDLKNTVLCIGQFFSSANRAELKVKSYSPCEFEVVATKEIITQVFPTYVSSVQSLVPTDSGSHNVTPSSSNRNTPKKP